MLISPSQKIAFIHIQKTAGSTIENILRAQFDDMKTVGTRHSSVKVGIETLDDWNQYFRFTFVRNPWDRLVSWYNMIEEAGRIKWRERNKSERNRNRYEKARTLGIWKYVLHNTSSFDDFIHLLARLKRYEKTHSKREFFIKNSRSFDDFVHILYNINNINNPRLIPLEWDQLYYLTDKNEKIAVDFVGRFESFQTDFGIICDRIGIDQQKIKPLNRITNRSNHKHYSEYYTQETRAIVQNLYQRDIDCFNYKFERTS